MINFGMIKTGYAVVKKVAVQYAPQILTGVGILCMGAATIKAIKTAPKAKEAITEIENDPDLSHKEYVKKKTLSLMKYYWPEFLMTFGGAGLIIGGQHISLKRLGVATAIIGSQKEELKELKEKIAEKYGNKELGKLQDEIAQDKVKKEVEQRGLDISTVYNTGNGNTLFYDPIGHRFFLSSLESIKQEEICFNNDISRQMQRGDESVMSLNDWYHYIDLPPLNGCAPVKNAMNAHGEGREQHFGPDIGKNFGWRNRPMHLNIVSGMLENGQTYFVVGFTENGEPKAVQDLENWYGVPYSDDETDMPWR